MIHMFSVSVIETTVNDLIPNILIVPNWTRLRQAAVWGLITLQSINCIFYIIILDELQFW